MILTRKQQALFFAPFLLVVVPFMVWPSLFGLFASFTNYAPFQKTPLAFVGLSNYARILANSDFQKALPNILLFTALAVSLDLLLGLLVAYRLRRAFRGRSLIRFILLLPWLISPVASGVMWRFLLQAANGIPGYLAGVAGLPAFPSLLSHGLALPTVVAIDVWRKLPLATFLLLPGLEAIPAAFWDLAELEGMRLWVRLRHIVLPHLRMLILTVLLLLIADTLATAESVLVLTGGGPGSETMTPGLYSYNQAINIFDWSGGATSAWLIAAAVLVVGLVYLGLVRRENA